MAVFEYGQAELDHLRRRDRKLGAVIDRVGMIEREVMPDLFAALVKSIVSQQISGKAAETVWRRLCDRLGAVTPHGVAAADAAAVQACGMSMRKAGYIKGIGEAALRGELDAGTLAALPDDALVKRLSALNGIGVWTAEMLMIFALGRQDVVSWGDLGIRRGMMSVYGLKTLDRARFERYRKRYAPFGSVASFYLWAAPGP